MIDPAMTPLDQMVAAGQPMDSGDPIQQIERLREMLRSLGLIGDSASAVGDDREASLDPLAMLSDNLAPMTRRSPQPDR